MAGQLRQALLIMESGEIQFGNISAGIAEFFGSRNYSRVAVLMDENTERLCYPKLSTVLPDHDFIRIESGESNKNLDTCQIIWGRLTSLNYDRNSLLVNLGGGVIGDMGGFCAATFKRGIDFLNLPTTLLAQVDASVGGKLGIDYDSFKNHIGVFRTPEAVLVDTDFLQSLDRRQLRSGFAEVIKHSLIADARSWPHLRSIEMDSLDWRSVVPQSVQIKKAVVQQDPTEKGVRKILNFGHTIGHAIEAYHLAHGGDLLHGEAIAAGMISEAWLSNQKTDLAQSELVDICQFLTKTFGKVPLHDHQLDSIVQLTIQDKKNVNSEVRFALLKGIGKATYDISAGAQEIRSALDFYLSL